MFIAAQNPMPLTIILSLLGAVLLLLIVGGWKVRQCRRDARNGSGYIAGVTDGMIGSDGHHHHDGGHHGDSGGHGGSSDGGHGGFSDGGGGGHAH